MDSKNNSNESTSQNHLTVNSKHPYPPTTTNANTTTGRGVDDDGLSTTNNTMATLTVNGIHGGPNMREIPSEACFAVNGLPLGINDPGAEPNKGWDNKRQFMLSVIGYSVGLGNIWRFPYLCQQNGGGAFLIPFLIMVVIEGCPLLLIELGIGQRLRTGSLGAWNAIHPAIGGIGLCSTIVAFLVGLYYNVIITWCIYFILNSFRMELPWATCPQEPIGINGSMVPVPECGNSSETAYFWYRQALDISPSIDETGGVKWWMALCLLTAWIGIYFIIMRGIQSSGKVVYFTALFPYLVLTIFFFRGITLKGSGSGLLHLYTPKMEKLKEVSVWLDAATQVFYSFGLAFGSLIAFGSYNKPKNNIVHDVLFITTMNALTAIYASAVIFSILGFKATTIFDRCTDSNKEEMIRFYPERYPDIQHISDSEYDIFFNTMKDSNFTGDFDFNCTLERELDEAAAGTGLAFVVFTQAIVELPFPPFWSIIFFMMLLALGIGSQIGTMEGVVSTVFETSYFSSFRKELLTGVICGLSFLVGLIFVTGAGEYWVSLFDGYASTTGLVIIALLETVSVMYIYGHERFCQDLEYMTGIYPGMYWQICWRFVGPIVLTLLLVGSFIDKIRKNPEYDAWNSLTGETEKKHFPGWSMGFALLMIITSVAPIIIVWIMHVFNILPPSGRPRSTSTTMRRIDTSASTRPMMEDYEVTYRSDVLPEETSDDMGEEPIRMKIPSKSSKSFRMDVIDC